MVSSLKHYILNFQVHQPMEENVLFVSRSKVITQIMIYYSIYDSMGISQSVSNKNLINEKRDFVNVLLFLGSRRLNHFMQKSGGCMRYLTSLASIQCMRWLRKGLRNVRP